MDPQAQFCPNPACPATGLLGQGNIRVHSRTEQRYRCTRCRRTFAATIGTPFYRLKTEPVLVTTVLTLLSHACPPQAIVAAFGLDERTVAAWQERAGTHCQQVHAYLVEGGRVDLGHVQADEVGVKLVGRTVWLAMAIAVPSRLWLGGVVSAARDRSLLRALLRRVRACAARLDVLFCVDGFAGYVGAIRQEWRVPVRTGKRGRPPLVLPPGVLLGQVVKQYAKRRVTGIAHRAVWGTLAAITAAVEQTGGGTQLNTAFIERLNATFRASLVPLVRRGRALARTEPRLVAGMWLVGTAYNFCWVHTSLRQPAPPAHGRKWRERTPAMAAGLTDHPWPLAELLGFRVPLPGRAAPPRRRCRPNLTLVAPPSPVLPHAA